MSVRKTLSYDYTMELVDMIDVIHGDNFPMEIYDAWDKLIMKCNNPHLEVPGIYGGYKVRKIELGEGVLKIFIVVKYCGHL